MSFHTEFYFEENYSKFKLNKGNILDCFEIRTIIFSFLWYERYRGINEVRIISSFFKNICYFVCDSITVVLYNDVNR